MTRLPMTAAAAGLLRALIARSGAARDRILLMRLHTVDWQSLTFVGERHELGLRLAGPDAEAVLAGLADGLEDADMRCPGHIVADIRLASATTAGDGSIELAIEALTIAEA